MKLAIYISVFVILFSSCSFFKNEQNPCDHLMEKDSLVDVLTELYIIETYLETLNLRDEEAKLDSVSLYYNSLFYRHNISKEELTEILNCYVMEEELINEVHDEVINSISILESKEAGIKEED
ncbi:MAG: DUF4296 domain-containing protein [Bacteroidota bacterium]